MGAGIGMDTLEVITVGHKICSQIPDLVLIPKFWQNLFFFFFLKFEKFKQI